METGTSGDVRCKLEEKRYVVGQVICVCLPVWRRGVGCVSLGVMPGISSVCSGRTGVESNG